MKGEPSSSSCCAELKRDLFQATGTTRTVRARELARTGQHLFFRITEALVLSNTMRISIDIDINESEIDLATELLSTLRSLTDQVRVRTTGGKKPIANGVHSPTENGQQTPPSPVAKPAPAPTPAPQPPPAQAPAQAPAPSNVDFPGVDPGQRQSLTTFIRAATSSTLQQVTQNLQQVLENQPGNDKLFISSYLDVLLSKEFEQLDESKKSEYAMYLSIVSGLSDAIKNRIQLALSQQVVKIMGSRARGNRLELLLPAFVFTSFLEMGLATVKGMLKMVGGFLKSPSMVTVGLTMLGKSFEMCQTLVLSQASPASLENLREQLDKLGPQYEYDIGYLNQFLHFKEPSFRVLATRSKVHSNPICAMMVDPQTNQLVSASRNGEVIIWDEYAKLLHRHKLPQQWAIGMVVNAQQREVIIATRGMTPSVPCAIVTIGLDAPWDLKATWTLKQTTGISCIVMLPGNVSFAVGEQRKTAEGTSNVIGVYPATGTDPSGTLTPVCTIVSQPGLVTCISGFQTSHQVLMSGSQGGPNGGLVQLWALHQPQNAVKGFALPPSAGFPTCLEHATGDSIILAGTSQKMIVQWDINSIGSTGPTEAVAPVRSFVLDGYPVTKLQFWQNPKIKGQVAVLTAHGCWHVDLSGDTSEEKPYVQHVQDVPGDDITYQALTWAGTHPYLYVGGQSMVIHACQLIR